MVGDLFFWSSTQTGLALLPKAEPSFKNPGSATVKYVVATVFTCFVQIQLVDYAASMIYCYHGNYQICDLVKYLQICILIFDKIQ